MALKTKLIATLALLTIGCSTVPVPLGDAETVPNDQILSDIKVTSGTPARVTVIRDRAFVAGSVVSFFFAVNGTDVVQLRTGQKYSFSVDPGEVFLSVRTNAAGGTNKPVQVQTSLQPSHQYVYRVGNDSNWTPMMSRDLELSK